MDAVEIADIKAKILEVIGPHDTVVHCDLDETNHHKANNMLRDLKVSHPDRTFRLEYKNL